MAFLTNTVGNGWKDRDNIDPNAVFQINDIELIIPPNNISITKEDMVWQWKTLRSNISTKIPSGHGVCNLALTITFTPDLLLHLHRLIVQFKHSPFCYVENNFVRQSICPGWPVYQNMAFTMIGLNVTPMRGAPGTFICELDLRWFNYFPYGVNFLYRDEWKTEPTIFTPEGETDNSAAAFTINTFGPQLREKMTILQKWDSDEEFVQPNFSMVESERPAENQLRTIENMMATHAGTVFDLLPLPQRMMPSAPTLPHLSNIYVRYINSLQQKALAENFGIDIANLVVQRDQRGWVKFTTGETPTGSEAETIGRVRSEQEANQLSGAAIAGYRTEGYKIVRGLHTGALDSSTREQVITSMLHRSKGISFAYHFYLKHEPDPALSRAAAEDMRRSQEEARREAQERIGEIEEIFTYHGQLHGMGAWDGSYSAGVNWSAVAESGDLLSGYDAETDTISKSVSWRYGGESIPGNGGDVPADHDGFSDYFLCPPIPGAGISKRATPAGPGGFTGGGFGERKPPAIGGGRYGSRYHHGIDFSDQGTGAQVGAGAPIYAAEAGTIAIQNGTTTSCGRNVVIYHSEGLLTGYCHMSRIHPDLIAAGAGSRVARGQLIGYVGTTGASSGPHLHFYLKVNGIYRDPFPLLTMKRSDAAIAAHMVTYPGGTCYTPDAIHAWEVSSGFELTEAKRNELTCPAYVTTDMEEKDVFNGEGITALDVTIMGTTDFPSDEEFAAAMSASDYSPASGVTDSTPSYEVYDSDRVSGATGSDPTWDSVALAIREQYAWTAVALDADGWRQYDEDVTVSNVLTKAFCIVIDNLSGDLIAGTDVPFDPWGDLSTTEDFQIHQCNPGVVLTGMSGGLRHIVASIPILGHEFPTHQHLGSIEPHYSYEFAIVDDSPGLDGLHTDAELICGMRADLQRNARTWRPIPDSWTLVTDSFITRLMGTFRTGDVFFDEEHDTCTLRKRTIITRSTLATVEGSPGRSTLLLDVAETNPYIQEELTPIAISTTSYASDKNEKISEVLHALYALELSNEARIGLMLQAFGNIHTESEAIRSLVGGDPDLAAAVDSVPDGTQNAFFEFDDGAGTAPTRENLPLPRSPDGEIVNLDEMAANREARLMYYEGTGDGASAHMTPEEITAWENLETARMESGIGSDTELDADELASNPEYVAAEKALKEAQAAAHWDDPAIHRGPESTYASTEPVYYADRSSGFWERFAEDTSIRVVGVNDDRVALDLNDVQAAIVSNSELIDHFEDYAHTTGTEGVLEAGDTLSGISHGTIEHHSAKLLDVSEFLSVYPMFSETDSMTGATSIRRVEYYYKTLMAITALARRILAEESLGGIPEAQVQEALFGLGTKPEETDIVRGRMWGSYKYWLERFLQEAAADDSGYLSGFNPLHMGISQSGISDWFDQMNWGEEGGDEGGGPNPIDIPALERGIANSTSNWDAFYVAFDEALGSIPFLSKLWGGDGHIGLTRTTFDVIGAMFSEEGVGDALSGHGVRSMEEFFTAYATKRQEIVNAYVEECLEPVGLGVETAWANMLPAGLREMINTSYAPEPGAGTDPNDPIAFGYGLQPQMDVVTAMVIRPMGDDGHTWTEAMSNVLATGVVTGSSWGMFQATWSWLFGGPIGEGVGLLSTVPVGVGAAILQAIAELGKASGHGADNISEEDMVRFLEEHPEIARKYGMEPRDLITQVHGAWDEMDINNRINNPLIAMGSGDIPVREVVNANLEAAKLALIRKMLEELGTEMLQDSTLMQAFAPGGTTLMASTSEMLVGEYVGSPCYPDLDLPEHPYYKNQWMYAMSPDFYMWNIYDDAPGGMKETTRDHLKQQIQPAIESAYRHYRSMQAEGLRPEDNKGLTIRESGLNVSPRISSLVHHPDGSNQNDMLGSEAVRDPQTGTITGWIDGGTGEMISAYPGAEDTKEFDKWKQDVDGALQSIQ